MEHMVNRLRTATSPYLLQHAGNPVDWWPWSDEAFAEASSRDVPVLLSVGYSACHWCHVMAHESFEDDQTAALMNEHLVSIKVDREERPDVDAVYMTATQAMTGQGGWPMTVFMTPDREPFYCGTYFPREAFQRLVLGVADAWRQGPGPGRRAGQRIAAALAEQMSGVAPGGGAPGQEQLSQACDAAIAGLESGYDAARGGFGGAPKFPPSMVLEFLLRHHERDRGASGEAAQRMAAGTMDAMARGGMYDQLAGGFARYSVDADWVVPHFEKMLYDNALLARVYAHWWRRTGSELARRVAADTCAWMIAELGTAEGGFASALDADSEGEEGKFYVWTPGQLREVLGDGGRPVRGRGVRRDRRGHVRGREIGAPASPRPGGSRALRAGPCRAARGARAAGPARQGRQGRRRLERPGDRGPGRGGAAARTPGVHRGGARRGRADRRNPPGRRPPDPHLEGRGPRREPRCAGGLRVRRRGLSGPVRGDRGGRWVTLAGQLLDTALDRFGDSAGGFYDTADDGERLIYRPADPADGPTPSGTFAVAGALLSYSALTGSARHRAAAAGALGPLPTVASRYPRAAGWGLAVAVAMASGPAEIAVVGPPDDGRTAALHRAALLAAPPGAVIALGNGGGKWGGAKYRCWPAVTPWAALPRPMFAGTLPAGCR